jgi:hypothetical protein
MRTENLSNENLNFSSEMNHGFGFIHTQNEEPYRNFLKKIEVDETNEKLTLTFSRFADKPIVIDFKNKVMMLSPKQQKPFKKFLLVTYEYLHEQKAVALKTFRFDKEILFKGIKYFKLEDMKNIKLTNFLDIYDYNYEKASIKVMKNDLNYKYLIPDFYKSDLMAS